MKITLPLAALAATLILAVPAQAANQYTVTASTSPSKSGTKAKPAPVGVNLGFTTKDPDGGRPLAMEKLAIALDGIAVNTNAAATCSAATIEQAQSDASCPSGSLIATGFANNVAGDRTNRKDASIRCYLTLRLHNSGNGKLALFVSGDPTAAGAKNCPIALATSIPITVSKKSTGTTLKLAIPESLKHPIATLTNSLVEMNLKVKKMSKKVGGRSVGVFETNGRCVSGKRTITLTFSNEGGDVAKQSTKARCS